MRAPLPDIVIALIQFGCCACTTLDSPFAITDERPQPLGLGGNFVTSPGQSLSTTVRISSEMISATTASRTM